MKFDKAAALILIKSGMTDDDLAKKDHIDNSLSMAIEEFALLVSGRNYIKKHSETIAINTREVTLKGASQDIKSIFSVKLETSSMFRTLDYSIREEFLDRYDDPNATKGSPVRFTQLELEGGRWPIIKFDVPTDVSYTLVVYYYTSAAAENIIAEHSITPIVAGAKAHFYGIETSKGKAYLSRFHELAVMVKGSDKLVPDAANELKMSNEDIGIRATLNSIRKHRT